jgi:TonB family protein
MSQRNVKSAPKTEIFSEVHSGWTDGVSHWLIHHAACRAPEPLSHRLEEEWLADLAARRSAMSRLRLAVGCCWATGVIALEHQPSSVPAASSVMAGNFVSAYGQPSFGFFSRRTITLIMVVSLHAAVFYGLLTTFTHSHGSAPPPPLQNQVIETSHPKILPPQLSTPIFDKLRIKIPEREFNVPVEHDPSHDVTAYVPPPSSPPDSRSAPAHVVNQVQGGPGTGFPNPDDFYPPLARYSEEQGIATVRVCVDVHGRLTSDPTTLQGTGSRRLDEGALKLARAGSGHYRATTEDGQPVNSCYPFRIRFQLKN